MFLLLLLKIIDIFSCVFDWLSTVRPGLVSADNHSHIFLFFSGSCSSKTNTCITDTCNSFFFLNSYFMQIYDPLRNFEKKKEGTFLFYSFFLLWSIVWIHFFWGTWGDVKYQIHSIETWLLDSYLKRKTYRRTRGTLPCPQAHSQHGRTPQLETIHAMTISSPDKEAVQIRAAPQKLAQIWMRGQPNVPHRQVLIPDWDPGRRGGTAHAVGIQTLHQGQLRRVFQHRCSGKIHPV